MNNSLRLTVTALLLAVSDLSAATHYVSLESTNPTPPYTSWATAATNIQDAVDAAARGDQIVVTNGVYAVGERETFYSDGYSMGFSRVAITKAISLRSVNGPQFTGINGGRTERCVYLSDGASLTGFTLTNGVADSGGGVFCESENAFLTNCVVTRNSASRGGGAEWGTLVSCTLSDNSATDSGGAFMSTLYNCTLSGNSGRGALWCTLYNCALSGNSMSYGEGGGAYASRLYNCTLTGNYAYGNGGGADWCWLYNCVLTGNSAVNGDGGGASASALYNCTLTGNSASGGGGVGEDEYGNPSTLYNCIVYFNTATNGANYDSSSTLNYCCTTPLPTNGVGNIAIDPQLASASHLSAESPCRGAGRAAYATGTDIDGEPWGNPPSIGCDEYHAGAVTGPLTVDLVANYTYVTPGYSVAFTALIEGRITASVWDFGDGVVVSNRPYARHAWAAPGDYAVELRAFNESQPGGVSATVTIHVVAQSVLYVAATSTNPQPPYTSWATAATSIQVALDAALPGALGVVVTNGVYSGWVGVNKPLSLRSVNGPQFTVINGSGTSLTKGASLSGFTLSNGYVGVYCDASGVVSNCVMTGNSGGGANGGTLYNCVLAGNSGVGARGGTLYNCVLTGNSGGGAAASKLYNCIVYFNTAANGANYDTSSTLNYCCTTPLPTNGVGNIALDPQMASRSHLSANSPCRGAGGAAYATGTDIDGEPWGNPPCIGCDEYHAGAVTGPLVVEWRADRRAVTPGYTVAFAALIEGRTTASRWDFGDGVVASNRPYASHAWTAPGDYAVVLRAYNESNPAGVSATGMVHVAVQSVLYVAAGSAHPSPPYLSWATAATNIQQAMDTTVAGAEIVVNNGVYAGGLAVTKPLTLRSVNGPLFTVIGGGGANQCVFLTDGASLTGFTLTNGNGGVQCSSTNAFLTNCVIVGNSACYGGGVCGGTLYNCMLRGNWATGWWFTYYTYPPFYEYVPGVGGGAYGSTLYNCTLTGNSANYGGGVYDCTLYNCQISGNWAEGYWAANRFESSYYLAGTGGGAEQCRLYNCTLSGNSSTDNAGGTDSSALYNCIVYYNTAPQGPNYDTSSTLNYCCTTPMPTNGIGNITNAPLFADYGNGNLCLQADSPCINAGNNAYVTTATDLEGMPRILGGTVDMGAYEFVPAAQRVQWLIALVSESGLRHPRPLLATLEAALTSLNRGNAVAAANQLQAFQNKVRAQAAPSNSVVAQTLIAAAHDVIDALQGGGSGALAARLHGLKHQPDGKVQLRLSGPAGRVHFAEASTNLLDWAMLGVAQDHGDGTFEFEDANAPRFPRRFYRIVSP